MMSLPEMSFAGGVMVLVIIALRAVLLNRIPKRTFIFLWESAMLRLILPFSIPSIISVYTLFGRLNSVQPSAMPQENTVISVPDMAGASPVFRTASPVTESIPVWTVIWLSGAIAALLAFTAAYAVIYRKYRCAETVRDGYAVEWLEGQRLIRKVRIRRSDQIKSPLTYGIFRPVILLPQSMGTEKSEQLVYILTHELVHIKRFDTARKFAAAIVLCVHWFNPAVWALFLLFNRDIELACDEAVLREIGWDCRSEYARALISMEEKKAGLSLYSHFSRNAVKERIIAIMKTKKLNLITRLAVFAAAIGVVGSFTTSAASEKLPDKEMTAVGGSYSDTDYSIFFEECCKEYEKFGLRYDENKDAFYFDGKLVRYFYDGVELPDGSATYCDHINEAGTVDVYTVREPVTNSDGSVNPFGRLTGIKRCSQEEFDCRKLSDLCVTPDPEVTAYAEGSSVVSGETFAERFERYKDFGIEYVEAENASGAGNVYCNGKLVKSFIDISPDGGVFSFQSADGGEINAMTVYDDKDCLCGINIGDTYVLQPLDGDGYGDTYVLQPSDGDGYGVVFNNSRGYGVVFDNSRAYCGAAFSSITHCGVEMTLWDDALTHCETQTEHHSNHHSEKGHHNRCR